MPPESSNNKPHSEEVESGPPEPAGTTPAEEVCSIEALRVELLAAIDKSSKASRRWEATLLIAQIVLTALIGSFVWHIQSEVTRQLEEDKIRLATQLSLSQDYYQKRLGVYVELHTKIGELESVLRQWTVLPDAGHGAIASTSGSLNELYKEKSLFLSSDLLKVLGSVWISAMELRRADPADGCARILRLIEEAEIQMRKDLAVDRLQLQLDPAEADSHASS